MSLDHYSSQVVLLNKDKIFFENQRFKEALECFDKCMSVKQGTIEYREALSAKGEVLFSTKRYNEVIEVYDQLLETEENPNYLLNKAGALFTFEKFEQALELLNEAIRLDPKHVKAIAYAGHCCLNLKRSEEALFFYDRALQVADRNDPKLENFLAEVIRNQKIAVDCYNYELDIEAMSDDFYRILLRFEA